MTRNAKYWMWVKCRECGTPNEIKRSRVNPDGNNFCDSTCYGKWQNKHVKIECRECGKSKKIQLNHVSPDGRNFCNSTCSNTWFGKRRRQRVKIKCKQCKKPKEIVPSQVNPDGNFCNHTCFGLWLIENVCGTNNPNYQGGPSFESYPLEFNDVLKEQIRKRDGRVCQIRKCGKTTVENGKALCVHHINYDKTNNHPDNLIALCNSCHVKTNGNRTYWQSTLSVQVWKIPVQQYVQLELAAWT